MRALNRVHGALAAAGLSLLFAAAGGCTDPASRNSGVTRPTPSPKGSVVGSASMRAIDSSGGTVASFDAVLAVSIPPNAVSDPLDVTIQQVTNTAPSGVGPSYVLGPEGTTFTIPVTITFQVDPALGSLDALTIGYQDGGGYWLRLPNVTRDAVARTISVTTRHFSAWALVTGSSPRDLSGTFTITSTLESPALTVDGNVVLQYSGENPDTAYYLLGGTEAPRPAVLGAATCTANVPTLELFTNVVELQKSPVELRWGTSGHWDLACTDGAAPSVDYAYDTVGISYHTCSRSYVGTQTIGPDLLAGALTIDCGTRGTVTGSWAFQSAACGTACSPSNPCATGAYDCATGTAACAETGFVFDGTSCGTTGQTCVGGVCQ